MHYRQAGMPAIGSIEDMHVIWHIWKIGRCPCCGYFLTPSEHYLTGETTKPQTVAEGVIYCGRCIENGHHTDGCGAYEYILDAIIKGQSIDCAEARTGYCERNSPSATEVDGALQKGQS